MTEFENSDEFIDEEVETITLTDDEGNDIECVILDQVEHNGKNYLLIIEVEDIEDEDAEAGIIREVAQDDESFTYEFIEDDAEFEVVSKLFMDSAEDFIIE